METYRDLGTFQTHLARLLAQGRSLGDCVQLTEALGIIEPFTHRHIPPDGVQILGSNYRETLMANDLLSRNRGELCVLEKAYGSLEALASLDIYLVEYFTGFAAWMRQHADADRLTLSEFLEGIEANFDDVVHQDLCALTYADQAFDLVLCNELFEHVYDLGQAFHEIARVLRAGGRLLATCPMAFGQKEHIVKAQRNRETGELELFGVAETHGDPLRPEEGSLVYQIPGWAMLDELRAAGFSDVMLHHVTSWKHGVLGSDLPGVLVLEAIR
ncbi:class I SAM-dependent methyltransferase [Cyanobium sp. NIES-981]|uniref:class I SAM-dependent methyltransferase n=1 Tax=Cyanobium sp. NIES-981 TaxID=1851505 RepID=UPI0012F95216|nr:class I SAM-dependent methyltransferase [Cyanobium sp. NIES-981]